MAASTGGTAHGLVSADRHRDAHIICDWQCHALTTHAERLKALIDDLSVHGMIGSVNDG